MATRNDSVKTTPYRDPITKTRTDDIGDDERSIAKQMEKEQRRTANPSR